MRIKTKQQRLYQTSNLIDYLILLKVNFGDFQEQKNLTETFLPDRGKIIVP
ncbi:MAG: hypothetical protein AB4080_05990 [Trichodesmium sp.]